MRVRFFRAAVLTIVVFVSSLIPTAAQSSSEIVVAEEVAELVRPVLDELQKMRSSTGADHRKVDELFHALTIKKGPSVDEALVVLMCFDVMGESQEDADAVIGRGRKMLPYVEKYRTANPKIPGRSYSTSLLKGITRKKDDFQGAVRAIQHGWRGTWDNPAGSFVHFQGLPIWSILKFAD